MAAGQDHPREGTQGFQSAADVGPKRRRVGAREMGEQSSSGGALCDGERDSPGPRHRQLRLRCRREISSRRRSMARDLATYTEPRVMPVSWAASRGAFPFNATNSKAR